jgi:hypothetical protein
LRDTPASIPPLGKVAVGHRENRRDFVMKPSWEGTDRDGSVPTA